MKIYSTIHRLLIWLLFMPSMQIFVLGNKYVEQILIDCRSLSTQTLKADIKKTPFLSPSLIDGDRILRVGIALMCTHSIHCFLLFDIECV